MDAVAHRAIVTNFLQSVAADLLTSCGLQIGLRTCVASFMEWTSMTKQLHPSHTSPSDALDPRAVETRSLEKQIALLRLAI